MKNTIEKDWTGNKNSVFKTLGASNHTDKERQNEDYYATDPIAIDVLIRDGKVTFDKPIWECACGRGDLSDRLKDYGYDVYSTDLVYRGYGKGGRMGVLEVLAIMFIVLKILGLIQWSWLWVLSPIWIIGILAIIHSNFKDI